MNLARLTRCNCFDDETVFNSYLENILATNYQFIGVPDATKGNDEKSATNESGFEDANDDDEDEWTDIDDDEE